MPVKTEPWTENIFGSTSLLDYVYFEAPVNPSTEPLLPDDIWKKFELDFPEFTVLNDVFDENTVIPFDPKDPSLRLESGTGGDVCHIRNHDCMWAGHCASKEHPTTDEPRTGGPQHLNRLIPQPPVIAAHQVVAASPQPTTTTTTLPTTTTKPKAPQPQQSLLKPAVRAANQLLHAPQTPPMSDDEEIRTKSTAVLQMLHQAINECDLEDDTDLCEYFDEDVDFDEDDDDDVAVRLKIKPEPIDLDEEDDGDVDEGVEEEDDDDDEEEEDDEEEKNKRNIRLKFAAESDHSYHKGKHASMNMQNLGIDTPSDSEEEEIDVVSVAEKFQQQSNPTLRSTAFGLPNRPSNRDRHHIQRRVATAIHKNRNNNNANNNVLREIASKAEPSCEARTLGGIKTLLPVVRKTPTTALAAIAECSTSSSTTTATSASPLKRQSGGGGGGSMKRQKHYKSYSNAYKRRHYSSDSEPEPSEKRSLHNNMERQRRIDLRNAFEDLRKLVPEVTKKERAAKVVILREAAKYCHHVSDVKSDNEKQIEDLKRQQKFLRNRVSQLRRVLAHKR